MGYYSDKTGVVSNVVEIYPDHNRRVHHRYEEVKTFPRPGSLRRRVLHIAALLFAILTLYITLSRHETSEYMNLASWRSRLPGTWTNGQPQEPGKNYAFATLLNAPSNTDDDDEEHDRYYTAVRMLGHQIMHDRDTASKYPFIVYVTPQVSQSKRDRLSQDGAQVEELNNLYGAWFNITTDRWLDVLVKLRMFRMTQFDRMAFLDGDMLLVKNIDGIFEDDAVKERTNLNKTEAIKDDEAPQPETYVFASVSEQFTDDHGWPPKDGDYFNVGCMIFKPSEEIYEHYMSVLGIKDRFRTFFPEQDMLNYIHRKEGNMPWQRLNEKWLLNYATEMDYKHGVHALHSKWWLPPDDKMRSLWARAKDRMESFYDGWDARL